MSRSRTLNVDIEVLIDDLRGVAVGRVTEQEFRAKYSHSHALEPVMDIWHGLEHFFADADIRERDPGYRAMQERELDRLIRLLQGRAPGDQLRAVTFLARSRSEK